VICDAGDIVVVPFPFVDVAAEKRRPSLVLSRRPFNQVNGHSICAMITTAGHSRWSDDIEISDLAEAGLNRPCVVRWKLFTLPNEVIVKKVGSLAGTDLNTVAAVVRTILI
jgi:mRNA interferase MazF